MSVLSEVLCSPPTEALPDKDWLMIMQMRRWWWKWWWRRRVRGDNCGGLIRRRAAAASEWGMQIRHLGIITCFFFSVSRLFLLLCCWLFNLNGSGSDVASSWTKLNFNHFHFLISAPESCSRAIPSIIRVSRKRAKFSQRHSTARRKEGRQDACG